MLSGCLFLLVVEFMYTYQIRGNLIGFFMTPIIQIPFLLVSYFIGKLLTKAVSSRIVEPIIYVATGLFGLIAIEWLYVGLTPWGSDAWQLLMFTFWGGAVVFARILTDVHVNTIKKWMLRYFATFSVIGIALGFFVRAENAIYLISVLMYGLMNLFYLWYFWIKYKAFSP